MRHYDPPNMRVAESVAYQCSNCRNFYLQRFEDGKAHGECTLYDENTRSDFRCDSWEPFPGHEPPTYTDQ
jgi:hypothetical protein